MFSLLTECRNHKTLTMKPQNNIAEYTTPGIAEYAIPGVLGALSRALSAIAQSGSDTELMQSCCDAIAADAAYPLAWIGLAVRDEEYSITVAAQAGTAASFLDGIQFNWLDGADGKNPVAAAIRTRVTQTIADLAADMDSCPWAGRAKKAGLASCVVVPISGGGEVIGVLAVYAASMSAFSGETIRLFEELADTAGFGIHMHRVRMELLAERQERESEREKKFHMIFDSANDGVMLLSMDGRIADINRICHERLGYTKAEMLGQSIADFDFPEFAPRVPQRMAQVMNGGEATFESAHMHRDGTVIPVEINARLVELGGKQMVLSVIRDITERKAVEERLRSSEAQYRAVIETSADGFWVVDMEGRLLEVNDAYVRLSGYSREELLNMRIPDIEAREQPEETAAHIENILRDGHDRFESYHRRKDGSVWPVEIVANFWPAISGRLFVFVVDITERKAAASKLELFRSAVEKSTLPLYWVSPEGQVFDTNEEAHRQLGYTREELLGKFIWDFNPEYRQGMRAGAWATLKEQKVRVFETSHRRKDGTVFPVEVTSNYISFEDREFSISFAQDITERKRAEEVAEMAERIYRSSSEAIMVTDENNFIVDVNEAFSRITGYAAEEVIGRNPRIMQSGRHDKEFYRQMWQSILYEDGWQGEIWDRRKDGSVYAKWTTISVIRHENGSVYRHVAQFSDITEKKQQEALIRRQASYDALTGLPNRRLFQDRLEQEIKKANRTGLPLVLLYLDLDRFKEINDTMGHAKGDILLVEAGRRIAKCVRATDTVARLGGDEFTVILPEMGDRPQLERIIHNIIGDLSRPFDLKDGNIGYISASIGIILYPNDARDYDEMVKHADQAMYAAKALGRNQHSYFTKSMQKEAWEKLELTNELRHALARNECLVYYQPIVDISNGQVAKAEALLRWNHPQRGLLSPALFIPLAEESGLIREIGEWVFYEVIEDIERWRKQIGRIVQVSVNKSPIQFDGDVRQMTWMHRLEALGLPGGCITVEITEGTLLRDSSRVKERLRDFQDLGVEVSLDDFGTGFSALSYLKQFDIDYLKIDRSFISHITENESDRALVEAIIVMAHKLGIKAIAEGVETAAQRDLLASFGCDYGQGFLYSPAVQAEEFEKLLAGKAFGQG